MIHLVDYILDKISENVIVEMANNKADFDNMLSIDIYTIMSHYALVRYMSIKNDNDECTEYELELHSHWATEILSHIFKYVNKKLKAGNNVKRRCIENISNDIKEYSFDDIENIVTLKIKKNKMYSNQLYSIMII